MEVFLFIIKLEGLRCGMELKMKRNSLQFELGLKISILFIVFIFAITSGIMIYMSNEYNKIIVDNMKDNMEKTVEAVDYYFEDVKTPIVMLARNDDILRAVRNYQNMTNKEKLMTANGLEDFVQNITTFKPFINDIIIVGYNGYRYNLYHRNQDKYLNDFNFIESSYLKKLHAGEVRLYYLGQHPTEYYLHENTREDVYSVILPIKSGKTKKGYVICDIQAEILNNILEERLLNEKSKLLILDEQMRTIYEAGNTQITQEELLLQRSNTKDEYEKKNLWEILFQGGNYVMQVQSEMTGWTYVYAEPYNNFNGFIKKIFLVNILVIFLGIAVILFLSKELSAQILKPLKNIAFMIREMKINEGLGNSEKYYAGSQNVNELGLEIERMIGKMDKLINDNYVYKLKEKDTRLQILINQLSPHFLYNTLQLIEYQSYSDNKGNVARIIEGLSYILRYAMNSQNTVCLKEEITYIRHYLNIYSLRYQEKLSYEINIKEELLSARVPKMLLEPLVGNSLKHGFAGCFDNAVIRIKIVREEEKLHLCVWDNGKGIGEEALCRLQESLKKTEVLEEHIGLNNTNSIIRLRYGEKYGITVRSTEKEFTEVTVKMPLLFGMDRETAGERGDDDEKGIIGR